MIDMGDITRVQQRIAQLQKSFMGLQQVPGATGFDAQLQQAIQAQKRPKQPEGRRAARMPRRHRQRRVRRSPLQMGRCP